MYTQLLRTDSRHTGFIELIRLLDAELAERDGAEHAFYAQYNGISTLQHVVVAEDDTGQAVACGAIKPITATIIEVKRMYTSPACRGRKIAAAVLTELERWAAELGYSACILETGKRQPEAIALYKRMGYTTIPNYGQYEGVENSVCFEKLLI